MAKTWLQSGLTRHLLLGRHVTHTHTHTHTRLTALCPGLPRWAGTRKVKPIWILLKQETVSGSGISWAICKSAPCSRQITMPAPHCSVFYRLDALPAAQPTASEHWKHVSFMQICDCHIFRILPHFSHISAKCAYRIFFLHKLAFSTAILIFYQGSYWGLCVTIDGHQHW